ncbi:MAG: RNA polymerase sigma factor [Pseudomonadota bacterium]
MPKDSADVVLERFLHERDDLLALARSVVGQPDVAEDLVQESWLRWQSMSYPSRDARPILIRIIKNLATDWHRRRAVELKNSHGYRFLRGETPDSERIVIARQQLHRVVNALAELPEQTILAFRMRRLEGLTFEEIGSRLGISKASAHRVVAQALVRIVVHLEEQ